MNAPQRQYDIGKTQALYELLKAPDSQRNESWRNAVFSVVTDAPLALAKTQMVQGPDGFPYFVLLIPDEGMEFSPVTLLSRCRSSAMALHLATSRTSRWKPLPISPSVTVPVCCA